VSSHCLEGNLHSFKHLTLMAVFRWMSSHTSGALATKVQGFKIIRPKWPELKRIAEKVRLRVEDWIHLVSLAI
jgi:hypothetical protein